MGGGTGTAASNQASRRQNPLLNQRDRRVRSGLDNQIADSSARAATGGVFGTSNHTNSVSFNMDDPHTFLNGAQSPFNPQRILSDRTSADLQSCNSPYLQPTASHQPGNESVRSTASILKRKGSGGIGGGGGRLGNGEHAARKLSQVDGQQTMDKLQSSQKLLMRNQSFNLIKNSDIHPKQKEREKFTHLIVNKMMANEDYLGIMLRDDHFLNIMSDDPQEDIKKIWFEMLGKTISPTDSKKHLSAAHALKT